MKSKLGRKGEDHMATELYDKQGTLVTLERMKKEYDLSDDIMKDLYDIVEDEERCKEILEHGPYAITGDDEKAIKAISLKFAAGTISGGCVPPPCTRTKSLEELYKEQVREYKKKVWTRRLAKLKRFLMGE